MHGRECVDESLSEEACAAAKECICVLRLGKACRIVSAEYFFLYLQAFCGIGAHYGDDLVKGVDAEGVQHGEVGCDGKGEPAPCGDALAEEGDFALAGPILHACGSIELAQDDGVHLTLRTDCVADAQPTHGADSCISLRGFLLLAECVQEPRFELSDDIAELPLFLAEAIVAPEHRSAVLPDTTIFLRLTADAMMQDSGAQCAFDRAAGDVGLPVC